MFSWLLPVAGFPDGPVPANGRRMSLNQQGARSETKTVER
jgi:hypothetical protein